MACAVEDASANYSDWAPGTITDVEYNVLADIQAEYCMEDAAMEARGGAETTTIFLGFRVRFKVFLGFSV